MMYGEPWIDDEIDTSREKDYPKLMEEIRRVLPRLTPDEQLIVAALVVETCPGCHEAGRGCHCMRDN